jgi:DNA-binding transcriptional LysR family regulator
VAEELHFSRAAGRLHMTQPPLSQQIRQLEEEIGVRLFYRTKREVQLTDAGRVFLNEVRLILAQADQAIRAAQRASRGETGRLVIGFVDSVIYKHLPAVLRAFRERFPSVELDLRELSTAEQIEALLRSEIHAGFLRPPVDDAALAFETILEEPLVVALPETHPLSGQTAVPLAALAGEPFVLFPRRLAPSFYDLIMRLCRDNAFSPKVAQEATRMQTILSLVAAGFGVSLVSSSSQAFRTTGVAYRPIQSAELMVGVVVAWQRSDLSPALKMFLTVVREIAHAD